ncbi:hypothetical protein [Methanospirillum lacunae]|uniref:Uncharacterized protein n=2 Tax=Methanospirillum lacunae TaxID=668570 RepID=A0A2V2MXP0_9EURY|nr:hypothetical protein [Methanospirillum lacunae]PWR72179.1 hypothetical protein DK846_09340 [Methanospirillum lacunae]
MTNIPPFEDYNPIQISESVKNLKLENYIEGDIIFDGRGNVISYNICRITPKGEKYLKKVLLGGTPTYGTLSGSILEK